MAPEESEQRVQEEHTNPRAQHLKPASVPLHWQFPSPSVLSSHEVGTVLPSRQPCPPQLRSGVQATSFAFCLLTQDYFHYSGGISWPLPPLSAKPPPAGGAGEPRGKVKSFCRSCRCPQGLHLAPERGKSNTGSVLQSRHKSKTEKASERETVKQRDVLELSYI